MKIGERAESFADRSAKQYPREIYEPFGLYNVWIGRVVAVLWLSLAGIFYLATAVDRGPLIVVVAFAVLTAVVNELATYWWRQSRRKTFDQGSEAIAKIVDRRSANQKYATFDIEVELDGKRLRFSGPVGVQTYMRYKVGDKMPIRIRAIRVFGYTVKHVWLTAPTSDSRPHESLPSEPPFDFTHLFEMNIESFKRFLLSKLGDDAGVRGCSIDEVEELESECGVIFPDEYRAFLIRAGRGGEQLWRGFDYTISRLPGLQDHFRELCAEAKVELPKDAFFFKSGQGVQGYFLTEAGVYLYIEGKDHYAKVAESFSEYLVTTNLL